MGRPLENGCLTEFYYPSRFYFLSKNFGTVAAISSELIVFAVFMARTIVRKLRRKPGPSFRARLAGGLFRKPKRP